MPTPGFVDYHYPPEEPVELREMLAATPFVSSAAGVSGNGSGTAVLGLGNRSVTVAVDDAAFGEWLVVSFIVVNKATGTGTGPGTGRSVTVVLERAFSRWSAVIYLSARPSSTAAAQVHLCASPARPGPACCRVSGGSRCRRVVLGCC